MKKLFALLLSAVLVLSMAACSSEPKQDENLDADGNVIVEELNIAFVPSKDPEEILSAAQRFLELGVQRVFISLGEKGVCYADRKGSGFVRVQKTRVVNTTGCGDAFMAGAVVGYVKNKTLRECAEMGQRASRICLVDEKAVSPKMNLKEVEGE